MEHLDHSVVKGRIYAPNIMEAGLVKECPQVLQQAYDMGKHVLLSGLLYDRIKTDREFEK